MKSNIKQELFSFSYILTITDNGNRTSRTQRQSLSFAKRKEIIACLNAIMSGLQKWLQTANVERPFFRTVETLLKEQKRYKEQPLIELLENQIAPKLKNSACQDAKTARQIVKDIATVGRLWAANYGDLTKPSAEACPKTN